MVYTVTLNPAIDYVVKIKNMNFDGINRAAEEFFFYGGKGINVSAVLNQLEISNTALGFVGGFTGVQLEKMLKSDNIVCDFNRIKSGETRVNVKVKSNKNFDINANGPAVTEKDVENLIKKLDFAGNGDFVVLAGSVPPNVESRVYERILGALKGRNIKFVVDTTGDFLLNTLKYKPFLVKPNHTELGEIFGTEINTYADAVLYAEKLKNMGAQNVLVSMGEKGAILVSEKGEVKKAKNLDKKVIDTTGCGDSTVAGFIAGCIKSGDSDYAFKLAVACGNATAFSPKLATKSEIKSVFELLY